jgi:hypothetical protein
MCLVVSGTNIFAGTLNGGVFLSTNNGTSWTGTGLAGTDVVALGVSGANLLAGTSGGLFLSTDNGASWNPVNNGLSNGTFVKAFAVSGTNLYAGTLYDGLFLSTDNGTSWNKVNNGLASTAVNALAVSGTKLFPGTSSGVFLSTNNGTSWTEVNTHLTNANVGPLAIIGKHLFAGTEGGGVWRRPLSDMIASVDLAASQMPHEFLLHQNYPKPFNPSTTIRYGLPHKSQVSLTVYNTLGQQVAQLVQGEEEAGYHEVRFDASGLSSGVYFFRLRAGDFVSSRKLLLLRPLTLIG